MIFRVSELDQMLWFGRLDDMTNEDLAARLRGQQPPNAKMKIGTAWHAILENPPSLNFEAVEMDGYRFRIACDGEIALPQIREIRGTKQYGDVTLSGGCDGITGNELTDHKLTFRPDPENYLTSYQWRAYLDIFNADRFVYNLYHAKPDLDGVINIVDISTLPLYRYAGMVDDLMLGINDLVDFCRAHVPERVAQLAD